MSYYPSQSSPEEDPLRDKKNALIEKIKVDLNELRSKKSGLTREYPQDAFYDLSDFFGDLATKYNRYRRRLFGEYRKLLNSSEIFSQTVEQLTSKGLEVSSFFDQCGGGERVYRRAEVTYLIDEFIIELENLRDLCKN